MYDWIEPITKWSNLFFFIDFVDVDIIAWLWKVVHPYKEISEPCSVKCFILKLEHIHESKFTPAKKAPNPVKTNETHRFLAGVALFIK
jgi:hypothetical protein